MNPVALPFVPEQDNRAESQGLTNAQPSTDQDVGQPPPLKNSTYDEFLKVQKKQANISEMIMMQQVRSSLPSHKPPTFTGDSMEYSRFINAFESLIESKVESLIERLYFLDQYTAGKAKEVIKGCIQMKSDDSYGQAKALLKKHFGDPFKVANAYITKPNGHQRRPKTDSVYRNMRLHWNKLRMQQLACPTCMILILLKFCVSYGKSYHCT